MTEFVGATALIAAFPAGGAGGTTLEQLQKLAARRGMAYIAGTNASSVEALESGTWLAECISDIRNAVDRSGASRVILVGHCMGGLSAIHLADGLAPGTGLSVRVLVINTPCPDLSGRIPTMSRFSDAEIAEALKHDGFPQDLLDDEDMLAEIADGLRRDAVVADRLADWIASADNRATLHVLATRGDRFIAPEQCAGWRHRVSHDFHLTITDGGHAIDETTAGVLERAVDAVLAAMRAEPM